MILQSYITPNIIYSTTKYRYHDHMVSSLNTKFLYRSSRQPVLVLLHGFLGDNNDWQNITNEINCSILMIDLPFHGKSSVLFDDSLDAYKQTSILLCKTIKLFTSKPIILLGYSLGARLAVDFSSRYPYLISKLILESYNPGLSQFFHRKKRLYQDTKWSSQFKSSYRYTVYKWYQQSLFSSLTPQEKAHMISKRLLLINKNTFKSILFFSPGLVNNQWQTIHNLTCPIMLITGSKDIKYTGISKNILTKLKDCLHQTINAGHNVHFESPEEYIICINQFLN